MQTRRFTGWHMTGLLVAFFAVVIAVNMLMATLAVRSFGGVVVDNSYVASQKFNLWLHEARSQQRLGWRDEVTLLPDRHVALTLTSAQEGPIARGTVTALAQHPLGRAPDIALAFHEDAPGRYASAAPLPAGRWQLRVTIRHGANQHHVLREID